MSADRKPGSPDPLGELDKRLKLKRPADRRGDQQAQKRGTALGFGFKIAVDLVSAVAVGFVLGYFLDWWLGTSPWFLMIMLPFGMAAGVLNVVRAAKTEEARRRGETDAGPHTPDA